MYRVWCRWNPNLARAAGSFAGKGNHKRGRGAWVVIDCHAASEPADRPVLAFGELGVLSPAPRRLGTRVNPRALLDEFIVHRRAQSTTTAARELCASAT